MILTKEDRHKQAEKWAKATGSGPGKREYINAYFAGYFDHAQTRSDPIEAHIIQQFEELERQLNLAHAAAIQAAVDTAYNIIQHGREHNLEGDEICADLMDALKELAPADAQRSYRSGTCLGTPS